MDASLKDRIAETHSLLEALTIVARQANCSGVIKVASSSLHGTVMFSEGRLLSASVPKGIRKGRKALDKLLTLTDAGIRYRAAADLAVKPDERLDLDINELLSKYPPVTIADLPESVADAESDLQTKSEVGAAPDGHAVTGKPARKAKKAKSAKPRTAKGKAPKPDEAERNVQALQGSWDIPSTVVLQDTDHRDVEVSPDKATTLVEPLVPITIEDQDAFSTADSVAGKFEPAASGQDRQPAGRRQPPSILSGVLGVAVVCALCAGIAMLPKSIRTGARATSGVQYGATQLRSLIEDESAEITPSTANDLISGKEQSTTQTVPAAATGVERVSAGHRSRSHHRRHGL